MEQGPTSLRIISTSPIFEVLSAILILYIFYLCCVWLVFLYRRREEWVHGPSGEDYLFIGPYVLISARWLREKAGLSLQEARKIVTDSRCPKWLVKFIDDDDR